MTDAGTAKVRDPSPARASQGSLSDEAWFSLVTFRDFLAARDRAMSDLSGQRLDRSPLRDELVATIVIEFGEGRVRSTAWYQGNLLHFGTAKSIGSQIDVLVQANLVLLEDGEGDRGSSVVAPAEGLIAWYDEHMGLLSEEIRAFLTARQTARKPSRSRSRR